MPRLGHKKSRLGCRQCKARHVKCDELKPCSNCARHGVPCSLLTAGDPNIPQQGSASIPPMSNVPKRPRQPSVEQGMTTPTSVSSSSLHVDYVHNAPGTSPGGGTSTSAVSDGSSPASQPDNYPFLSRFIRRSEATSTDIWVRDLELMHHWTIEAYDHLSQRQDVQYMWKVEAPKHAVTYVFLMHEMLAFSAFHKAHKTPDRRVEYYSLGIQHQDLAIRGIRKRLQNLVAHEAAPIVATSTMLTLSVFASTGFEASCPDIATGQNAIDDILNIFNLMQGMGNVLAIAQQSIMESFLAPMFRDALEPIASQPMLEELVQHIPPLTTFIQGKRDMPEPERQEYLKVIASFEPVLQLAMPPYVDNRELRFLFFWPLHLEQSFLSYMRNRHDGALTIIMFYATLLYASEPRYWFMEGWARRLMRTCYDSLDQSWIPAVQWPLSFLNQSATFDLFSNLVRSRQVPGMVPQTPYTQRPLVQIPHRDASTATLLSQERKPSNELVGHDSGQGEELDQKPRYDSFDSRSAH